MVDRIMFVIINEDIVMLRVQGVEDVWFVVCEFFDQWVIEDDFCNIKLCLDLVGVQFVSDVVLYEKFKFCMFNVGYLVFGLVGFVVGFEIIYESVEVKQLKCFLLIFME